MHGTWYGTCGKRAHQYAEPNVEMPPHSAGNSRARARFARLPPIPPPLFSRAHRIASVAAALAALLTGNLHAVILSSGGIYDGRDFSGLDLTGEIGDHGSYLGTNLATARLCAADLSFSNLNGANLKEAILDGANLSASDLTDAALSGASLRFADLRGATIADWQLASAQDLTGVNLSGNTLAGFNLAKVNLAFADLSRTDLRKVDFSEANLQSADLEGTNFSEAQLHEAADVSGANLSGLDLRGFAFEKMNLRGVVLAKRISPPPRWRERSSRVRI